MVTMKEIKKMLVPFPYLKYCKRGRHILEKENFGVDSRKPDGLACLCNFCKRLLSKIYYAENSDKWKSIYTPRNTEWKIKTGRMVLKGR